MGFFAEFDTWLRQLLDQYIDQNTQAIAQAIEPLVLALATLYIMIWAYLQMTGRIEEPVTAGLKRMATIAAIFAITVHLWLYDSVIVQTFFEAPRQLAAVIIGAYSPIGILDEITFSGDELSAQLFRKADIWTPSYALAGMVVYLIMGFTAVYIIFLLSLSRIALSILLALGPLFIAFLFFESTKRFFEAWMAQLVHYAMVAVLAVLVASLMMTLVATAARSALQAGDGIQIAHAARVCMAAGLTFLVMRQVNVIAAGLASGISLATGGVLSGLTSWALGRSLRSAGQFARGALIDRETTRWDSLSRKVGYRVGALRRAAGRAASGQRRNSLRRA
jgi:type IV secretion system protein VirB6